MDSICGIGDFSKYILKLKSKTRKVKYCVSVHLDDDENSSAKQTIFSTNNCEFDVTLTDVYFDSQDDDFNFTRSIERSQTGNPAFKKHNYFDDVTLYYNTHCENIYIPHELKLNDALIENFDRENPHCMKLTLKLNTHKSRVISKEIEYRQMLESIREVLY